MILDELSEVVIDVCDKLRTMNEYILDSIHRTIPGLNDDDSLSVKKGVYLKTVLHSGHYFDVVECTVDVYTLLAHSDELFITVQKEISDKLDNFDNISMNVIKVPELNSFNIISVSYKETVYKPIN